MIKQILKARVYRDCYGAIDIGSNAIRMVIASSFHRELHILKNKRFELRLGDDVFNRGEVSHAKKQRLEDILIDCLHSFSKYDVVNVRACATSALRNASNSAQIIKDIFNYTGILIELIDGQSEATLIHQAVNCEFTFDNSHALLVDIGGGSTEITICNHQQIITAQSFKVGTVRVLSLLEDRRKLEDHIRTECRPIIDMIQESTKSLQLMFGTGGNLRTVGKLKKYLLQKKNSEHATIDDIEYIYHHLWSLTFEQRIERLELRKDRADVILPATYLIFYLMKKLKIKEIILPKVGLKDGILLSQLKKTPKKIILWI